MTRCDGDVVTTTQPAFHARFTPGLPSHMFQSGDEPAIIMLLAAGADLCARDNNNKMPIQHAEDVPGRREVRTLVLSVLVLSVWHSTQCNPT